MAAQDVRTPAWFAHQAKRLDESLPGLMEQTRRDFIQNLEDAKRTGQSVPLPSLPPAEREGQPLRVIIKRNASGGGEVGAEILRGRQLRLWTINDI